MASPGCRRGQWGPRCSIHARRNLPDKAFGYLKRVRVTPGVNWPLARLNPSFRYQHRPGFSDYTHPFGLAVACVFIKQSRPPCHCNLPSPFLTKTAGIPYTEATGLICRIPSPYVIPVAPWLSKPAHLCRIWVRARSRLAARAFMVSETRENPANAGPFPPRAGSRHYDTPPPSNGWTQRRLCSPYLKATRAIQAPAARYWNINQFAIRVALLRQPLGPTNSRLKTHCLETLTLAVVWILTILCCYCRQDLQ